MINNVQHIFLSEFKLERVASDYVAKRSVRQDKQLQDKQFGPGMAPGENVSSLPCLELVIGLVLEAILFSFLQLIFPAKQNGETFETQRAESHNFRYLNI